MFNEPQFKLLMNDPEFASKNGLNKAENRRIKLHSWVVKKIINVSKKGSYEVLV